MKGVAAFAQFPVDQIVDTYRRLFGRLGTNVSRMAKLQWLARWSSGFGDEMSRPDPRYISPKSRSEVYRSSAYLMTAVLHDERDEWEMCVCVLITNRLTLSDGLRAFRRDYLLFLLPPPPPLQDLPCPTNPPCVKTVGWRAVVWFSRTRRLRSCLARLSR